jgi:hypothetical protein
VLDPEDRHSYRTNQPQQHIHKINPNGMFHPEDSRIALCVGFDVEVPEDSKDGYPEDEEDRVPDEEEGNAADEWDEVEEGGYGGEGGSYFCKGLIGDDCQSIVHDVRRGGENAGQVVASCSREIRSIGEKDIPISHQYIYAPCWLYSNPRHRVHKLPAQE